MQWSDWRVIIAVINSVIVSCFDIIPTGAATRTDLATKSNQQSREIKLRLRLSWPVVVMAVNGVRVALLSFTGEETAEEEDS
jgi:hypothetical protein